jgi:Rod binding domain-containing protein
MDHLAIPDMLSSAALSGGALPAKISPAADPAKIREAAQQFEALLLNQILSTASESGGWLGSGEDSSSACATGLAEQQLASAIAKNGGIGLAGLIAKGLQSASAPGPSAADEQR